jgi:DNA polymerase III subunit epsilon
LSNKRPYIDKKNLSVLPQEAGVYFLYQDGNLLVYIGKANSIRNRVVQHDKEKVFCGIEYELTHYSRARTLEKELLSKYEEEHGQLPYYNRQH